MALAVLAGSAIATGPIPERPDFPPNIVLIVTDDQSYGTLPSTTPGMPWLQSQISDPDGHWSWFPNAFVNTPLCCPSRASILTGLYSHNTGVRDNTEGHLFDETETLATWLHDAGYHTMLVGKYLNHFPFQRGPYIPPGWDRFLAKGNDADATVYENYPFYENGVPYRVGDTPETYVTDLLADRAVGYLRAAPKDRPFFLYFAPPAPHAPRIPADRYGGAFANASILISPAVDEADVSDKPAWVQALPRLDPGRLAALLEEQRRERETLLAVDDAVRRLFETLEGTGELDRTVVFFLTDNGFSYGEHRFVGKPCPYDACTRTAFAAFVPIAGHVVRDDMVSNVDLAPTIASWAEATTRFTPDGADLTCLLDPHLACPISPGEGVLIEWAGDGLVPAFDALRTERFLYVEYPDGFRELYDIARDPAELENVVNDPTYVQDLWRLANLLHRLRGG